MPRQVVLNPYIKPTAAAASSFPSSPPRRVQRPSLLSPNDVGLDALLRAVAVVDLDGDDARASNPDDDEGAPKCSDDGDDVPPPAVEYSDLLCDEAHADCSRLQWGVPKPRANQILAFRHLADPSRPRTLLLAERTGGGKTHVTRVVGTVERGVTLVIVPLLALSADQLAKFKEGNQDYGSIEAHHMDEVVQESRCKVAEIINRIGRLRNDTSSTIFVICSPQFFINNPAFTKTIVAAGKRRILRLVVLDEVHLYVQHGSSFRADIRQLKDDLFVKVFPPTNQHVHPKVILATGTIQREYIPMASSLTTIGLPPTTWQWGSSKDFEQRNITMDFANSANHLTYLDRVRDFVAEADSGFVCVFTSSREKSHHLLKNLERKLNEKQINVDVIHVHGYLKSEEKFYLIRIFCEKLKVPSLNARILLATPAANVGIDNHEVKYVVILGWTRDLCTFFQQRGRCGRVDDQNAQCLQVGDITSFLSIMRQTLLPMKNTRDGDTLSNDDVLTGINTAISPMRKSPANTKGKKTKSKYDLTPSMTKAHIKRGLSDLLDVLRFHCLDLGCQHVRAEQFLSTGKLTMDHVLEDSVACGDKCAICNGTWQNTFLPVVKSKVEKFIRVLDRKYLPLAADKDNLVNVLWKDEKPRIEGIYGKKTVAKYNVGGLFLQLLANGIIVLRKNSKGDDLEWALQEISDPNSNDDDLILFSELDGNWIGINFKL